MITEPTFVRGTISSVAFEGHRFVIGNWQSSPVGRMVDVMWVTDVGRRTLLVAEPAAAEFITAIYSFDEVRSSACSASRSTAPPRPGRC